MATDGQKLITITVTTAIKGKVFKPNEQVCYSEKVTQLVGCGCGGKKKEEKQFYRHIGDGGIFYDIPVERAVETDVVISCRDQNFEEAREDIGDTNKVQDFNPYRVNNNPYEILKSANNIPM